MIRTLGILAALFVTTLGVLATSDVEHAHGQQAPTPVFEGELPERGGMTFIAVRTETTPAALIASVRAGGCDATMLAITRNGAFRLFNPGAPAFVNAAFPSTLPAGSLAAVRCPAPLSNIPDAELLQLVTKDHALPPDFVPADLTLLPTEAVIPGGPPLHLTEQTVEALERLLEAARVAGHDIRVRSAYRSYAEQVYTHQFWVDLLGAAEADRRSARAGHSEHQLGTVVDVTSASVGWGLEPEFGATPEGEWLQDHAWRFGFVESYPEGEESTTGYRYEPWHLRYVGETHADWMRQTGLTLTEYLTTVHAGSD